MARVPAEAGRRRSRPRAVAVAIVVAVVAVGCGGESGAKKPAPTTSTTSTSTTAAPTSTVAPAAVVLAPLLGAPPTDPTVLGRPALAIKIDNSPSARPQYGVNRADLVVEIQVEGITRLMAVFHSQDAPKVGPTRSARYSDPDILALFVKPLFGWSGANEGVTDRVLSTPWIKNVHWNSVPKLYSRTKEKKAPHNLITRTAPLFALADPGQPAPVPIFDYLAPGESNPGALPLPGFGEAIAGTTSQWVWDAAVGQWLRWEYGKRHSTDEGQAWAHNVVVLQTKYSRGPVARSLGTGAAWVMTNGTVVQGTWTRNDRTERYALATADGQPMRLTPGRTWIELPDGQPVAMTAETASGMLANGR